MGRAKWTEEQKMRASLAQKKRWALRRKNMASGKLASGSSAGGAPATSGGGDGSEISRMSIKGLIALRRRVDQEIVERAITENA